jgi:hypothetical protein
VRAALEVEARHATPRMNSVTVSCAIGFGFGTGIRRTGCVCAGQRRLRAAASNP